MPPTVSLNYTIGALEIGAFTSIYLFGLVTSQVYIYFRKCAKDPWGLKLLVALVWSLDIGHTVAIASTTYTSTIAEFGRPDLLDVLPRSLDVAIALTGMIGLLEQGWFEYRLHKFSKQLALPILCFFLSILRLAGSMGLFAIALRRLPLPAFEARAGWLITAILAVGVSVDCTLTATLCYHLRYSPPVGFRRMTSQLMTWTIETGIITMCGAFVLLVTFLTLKTTFIWIGCFVVLPKLYSGSLLLSLNSRARLGRVVDEIMMANARGSDPPDDVSLSTVPPSVQLDHATFGRRLEAIIEEEWSSAAVHAPPTFIALA
ncbi:hypothetical protein B0H15DRAFT_949867 [Mycena belliarum]|uniref:DUF6534 domain-containing protein n=1 Tax=Mycena belliarum TaxID=1033014 RepID=A0AAD6U504_9AGAR|nr:hypothetical protein B0H15DRAFT_949867 [Mycena belliae]